MAVITKEIHFHMGHRVPSHQGKCRFPHGHTYHLRVYVEGDLVNLKGDQEEGMVMDFGFLRDLIEERIKGTFDHRLALHTRDPLLQVLSDGMRNRRDVGFLSEGIVQLTFVPTAENLAQHFFNILEGLVEHRSAGRSHLKKVTLFETPTSSASVTERVDV